MKVRSGLSCLMAAVASVSVLSTSSMAVIQVWDANGTDAPFGADGGGTWNLSNQNWTDTFLSANSAWVNGNSAFFGNVTNAGAAGAAHTISIGDAIVAQDIILSTATTGVSYSINDFGGGSLTLNGNLTKRAPIGQLQLFLNNGLQLGPGNHVFAIRDTPDNVAELTINAEIKGDGSVTLDNNQASNLANEIGFGTMVWNFANSYTGTTDLVAGRLVITDGGALGTTGAGTTIGDLGALSFGANLAGTGQLIYTGFTLNEPLTITRSAYGPNQPQTNQPFAISNNGQSNTIAGPITINTPDARIQVNGGGLPGTDNTLTITTNLVTSGLISVTGGGNGVLVLTGDNTGVAGGFNIRGGVLAPNSENAMGGPNSILTFGDQAAAPGGGGYLRVLPTMNDFGNHVVNYTTFSGGLDIQDANQTFTISQDLTGGQIVKRGAGKLVLSGTNVLPRESFIDAGILDIVKRGDNTGGNTSVGSLRIRNGTVNLTDGTTYTTTLNHSNIGSDPGENGTLNLTGSAIFNGRDSDFNISDIGSATTGAGSKGTVNISGTAQLNLGGVLFISKNNNTEGTLNQSGTSVVNVGTQAVRRNMVIGNSNSNNVRQAPLGTYNMNGGTLTVTGETQIGNQLGGVGKFIMTAGNVTTDSWFSVGRFGGEGLLDISGGKITNTSLGGGTAMYVGESNGDAHGPSVANIRGTGVVEVLNHEFWIGQGRTRFVPPAPAVPLPAQSGVGTVNISDDGQLLVNNNWIAVGRDGGIGTLNVSGNGLVWKRGAGNFTVGSGTGGPTGEVAGSDGKVFQTGGTIRSNSTFIGQGGQGLFDVSAGTANLGALHVGRSGTAALAAGQLKISGTATVTAGAVLMGGSNVATDAPAGTINHEGGTFVIDSLAHGIGVGTATVNWTGGRFSVGNWNLPGGLNNTGATTILAPATRVVDGGTGLVTINPIGANASQTGYTQSATGKLAIDLASASSFDTLAVTGTATLNGKITLALLDGYVPAHLAPHAIISATEISGIFNGVEGLVVSPTRSLAVTYSTTGVVVRSARPGDATVDGNVDFDDLLALAQNYGVATGKHWALGDFNGDGGTTFDDLLSLAQNYNTSGVGDLSGTTAGFQADWALAQSLVPEPTSLAALGLVGMALTRRRR